MFPMWLATPDVSYVGHALYNTSKHLSRILSPFAALFSIVFGFKLFFVCWSSIFLCVCFPVAFSSRSHVECVCQAVPLFKSSLKKDRAILSETSGQRKLVCLCWGRAKRLTWPSKNPKNQIETIQPEWFNGQALNLRVNLHHDTEPRANRPFNNRVLRLPAIVLLKKARVSGSKRRVQ